jgi:hypothetical protein
VTPPANGAVVTLRSAVSYTPTDPAVPAAVVPSMAKTDNDLFEAIGRGDWNLQAQINALPDHDVAGNASGAYVTALGSVTSRQLQVRAADVVNVKDFGAAGNGSTDDTAAIQAAIAFACPYAWQGSTRLTEVAGSSGTVFFPKGRYRYTSKLRLAPGLRLVGVGPQQWFNEGQSAISGSVLYADFTSATSYAIDTSPYDRTGSRRDDAILNGQESTSGDAAYLECLTIENLAFEGNWGTRGINLAGATTCRLSNVRVYGHTVGIRVSASWYGSFSNVRIEHNWRGLIVRGPGVTTLSVFNLSIGLVGSASVYDPVVTGWDVGVGVNTTTHVWSATRSDITGYAGTTYPVDAWTQAFDQISAGIQNVAGAIVGSGVTIEGSKVGYNSFQGKDDITGLYFEAIQQRLLQISGLDAGSNRFDVYSTTSPAANFIWVQYARLTVRVRNNNYTVGNSDGVSGGFKYLFEYVQNNGAEYLNPIVEGVLPLASGDPISAPNGWELRNAAFNAPLPTKVALVVRGAASQTAKLQEWRTSADAVVAHMAADGTITGADAAFDNAYISVYYPRTADKAVIAGLKANGAGAVGVQTDSYNSLTTDGSRLLSVCNAGVEKVHVNSLGGLSLGAPTAAWTANAMYSGTGAPNDSYGANGDFYFRRDGGAATTIYHKRTGTWTGVV